VPRGAQLFFMGRLRKKATKRQLSPKRYFIRYQSFWETEEAMTKEEQNIFLSEEYTEAIRYMDNAKEALQKAKKENDGYYKDEKYVRTACGIAYLGVLIALDAWFKLKGVQTPKKRKSKSIEFYEDNVAKLDGKMLSRLNSVYNVLHLEGYYRSETNAKIISAGFETAYEIIDKIKPENLIEIKESKVNGIKRVLDKLLVSVAATFG